MYSDEDKITGFIKGNKKLRSGYYVENIIIFVSKCATTRRKYFEEIDE